jgi:hypothetical protein
MSELLQRERNFHDRWAESIDVDGIRVRDYFEACTAPENRFILGHLGDVNMKPAFSFIDSLNSTSLQVDDSARCVGRAELLASERDGEERS